jgi:hypothetical protein
MTPPSNYHACMRLWPLPLANPCAGDRGLSPTDKATDGFIRILSIWDEFTRFGLWMSWIWSDREGFWRSSRRFANFALKCGKFTAA